MEIRLRPETRFPALDGLRGVAILLVLVMHAGLRLEPANAAEALVRRVLDLGWIGVDLFFVLSGFLITGILHDARHSRDYFKAFYARRALRIFPLYYLLIGSYLVLLPLLLPQDPGTMWLVDKQAWWWAYASNVLFATDGWNAAPHYTSLTWSLAVEEQFYLVWPLFVLLVPRRLDRWCLIVAALAAALRLAVHLSGWELAATILMPTRMDAFAIGGWLAVVLRERGIQQLQDWSRLALIGGGIGVGIGWLVAPRPTAGDFTFWNAGGLSVSALFFAGCIVAALSNPGGFVGRIGLARPLRWCGQHAYGLYLLHAPVRLVLDHASLDPPHLVAAGLPRFAAFLMFATLMMALSMALAALSWRVIEAPILSLKRFFPYGGSGLESRRVDPVAAVSRYS